MILKIVGVCIFASLISVMLKQSGKSEMAMLLVLTTTVFVLFAAFKEASHIIEAVRLITEKTNLDLNVIKTVTKITGIAYISQSASELCKDVGEGALSGKVELCGKILICAAAIPYVNALFSIISDIL